MKALKRTEIQTGIFILVLLFVTILFHSIEFRVAVWNLDEFIFSTAGQKLLAGGTLYRDFGDNKPPLIYYTYALLYNLSGGNYFWFLAIVKSATIFVVFFTALAIFLIGKNLADRTTGMAAGLLYAAYTICAPGSEVLGGRTEIYATFLIAVSIYFFTRKRFALNMPGILASGFFISQAMLYNTRFGILAAAYGFFILYRIKFTKGAFLRIAVLGMTFSLPLASVPLFYYHQGIFDSYTFWQSTVFKHYLSAYPLYGRVASGLLVLYFLAGILPLAIYAACAAARAFTGGPASPAPVPHGSTGLSSPRLSRIMARVRGIIARDGTREPYVFLVILSLCMYLAFFAGGIPGVRYFYMLFIPLSILGAMGFVDIYRAARRLATDIGPTNIFAIIAVCFLLLPPPYFYIIHWSTPRPTIHDNKIMYRPVADYIKAHTAEHDRIYVWYNVTPLYLYSGRAMATSMIYPGEFLFRSYYFPKEALADTTAWDLFLKQIKQEKPALILDETGDFAVKKEATLLFHSKGEYVEQKTAEMRAFIEENYSYVETVQGFRIFRLRR
jgi:hypothetical protein